MIVFNDIPDRIEQEKHRSAFVSTVSHELRPPLTSIKGAMGLLLSRSAGELTNKAEGLLEIPHRNAGRLILMVNYILDLDKISNGEMEFELADVDLTDLVKEANQANITLQQRFGVDVEFEGTDRPVMAGTDSNRFLQVLPNLLTNAYKFSKAGGKITISLECVGEQIRVSVKDRGAGIPHSSSRI
jgi:signal transduction histidine kinase